jgi:hypothetical protein
MQGGFLSIGEIGGVRGFVTGGKPYAYVMSGISTRERTNLALTIFSLLASSVSLC